MHDDKKELNIPKIGIPNHCLQKYLVYGSTDEGRKNLQIVYGDNIFQVIQSAKMSGYSIVVCKIGECVID